MMPPKEADDADRRGRRVVLDGYPVLARILSPNRPRSVTNDVDVEFCFHARLYRTIPQNTIRGRLVRRFATRLGIHLDEVSLPLFEQRIEPFLAESLARMPLIATIDGRDYALGRTNANGHLSAVVPVRLPADRFPASRIFIRTEFPLSSFMDLPVVDVPHEGVSVISDVDDTIKLSNVHLKRELLLHTFSGKYRAVPGMAEVYSRWSSQGARFHYVSATPWQLYRPLSRFLETSGYPAATFHLRQFRLKDRSTVSLLRATHHVKRRTLSELVQLFPSRTFVLVGDSSEGDALLYAELQQKFGGRISRILIRDTGMRRAVDRVFRTLPMKERSAWQLFHEADEIAEALRE